ncbi:hypothetical protein BKA93DRAFT_811253 [Sparassis latifolia]
MCLKATGLVNQAAVHIANRDRLRTPVQRVRSMSKELEYIRALGSLACQCTVLAYFLRLWS